MRMVILLLAGTFVAGCGVQRTMVRPNGSPLLNSSERLIDAFYSFDPARLRSAMSTAPSSLPQLLYYQGWAEGGNYVVLERRPCRFERTDEVRCDITVRDDLIAALGTSYHVTDTFHITLQDGRIVRVRTSSNDPPQFDQALDRLRRERPGVFSGPCRGFFAGGPTPQDCVRAVVRGFADFAGR